MNEDTIHTVVNIVGLAPDGIALDPVHDDRYLYSFLLAPPPDHEWSALLMSMPSTARDTPPFIHSLRRERMTAAFQADMDAQHQLDCLKNLITQVNIVYTERYPNGPTANVEELRWQQERQERLRPARIAASTLRF